jgi:hypothetical protein
MSTVIGIKELGGIGNTSAPALPATELCRAWWSPQNRAATILIRAHEIPLVATKPSRSRREDNRLLDVSHFDPEIALMLGPHLGFHEALVVRVLAPPQVKRCVGRQDPSAAAGHAACSETAKPWFRTEKLAAKGQGRHNSDQAF